MIETLDDTSEVASLARARARYPVVVVCDQELIGTALATALRSGGVDAYSLGVDDVLGRSVTRPAGLMVLGIDPGSDVGAPVTERARLVRSFRTRGWKVLVVGGDDEDVGVAAAVAAGAVGVVPRCQPFSVLLKAVATAAAGAAVMTEGEHRRWLRRHQQYVTKERELTSRLGRLTPREREVLTLLADGLRAAVIAEQLGVSMPTVRTQIRAILAKMQVGSQLEAVALCRRPDNTAGRQYLSF